LVLVAVVALGGAQGGNARAAASRIPFRVCLVTGADGPFGSLGPSAVAGLEHAAMVPGVAARRITADSPAAFAAGLRSCAGGGADLTIAAGFPAENAVDAAAAAFPGSSFAAIGVDVQTLLHRPRNVHGVLFAGEEAGYLAGYAAGLWARAVHGRAVGSVAGLDIPPAERLVAGYEDGAVRADPGLGTVHTWAGSFDDPGLCRSRAADQVRGGAVVEFATGGRCGTGVAAAAAQARAQAVALTLEGGTSRARSLLQVRLRVDVAVESVIAAARAGRLGLGRNAVVGATDGVVSLGSWSPQAPAWLRARVERQFALLRAGGLRDIPVRT
jgi:basic membrane protein A